MRFAATRSHASGDAGDAPPSSWAPLTAAAASIARGGLLGARVGALARAVPSGLLPEPPAARARAAALSAARLGGLAAAYTAARCLGVAAGLPDALACAAAGGLAVALPTAASPSRLAFLQSYYGGLFAALADPAAAARAGAARARAPPASAAAVLAGAAVSGALLVGAPDAAAYALFGLRW